MMRFTFKCILLIIIGLLYGIIENDMKYEFMYLGTGIVIFLIGFIIEKR